MSPATFTLDRRGLAALILAALAYQWLQHEAQLLAVWREGAWFDTDDAMRMVTVRAFLDGQGWFDLVAHRMGGHEPVVMHWSRVVDVPLALMIRGFEVFVAPPLAETLTRIAFPALLLILLLIGLMKAATAVAGPTAGAVALLLGALGGPAAVQFVPGRIDHHAPQIVLLTFAIAALLESFQPGREKRTAMAGALFALSLSISVENLPFILAATGMLGLVWVLQGGPAARQLSAYALGLVPPALLLFFVTVPPGQRTAEICDAFGAAHLIGILAGSALLCLCAAAPVSHRAPRLLLGLLAGVTVLLLLRQTYPACLGDPFASLPPLLREVWLQEVAEAFPLARLLAQDPWSAPALLGPPLMVLAALAWLWLRTQDAVLRAQVLVLAALCLVGLAAATWMIRAESSLAAPVMIAGAVLARVLASRLPPGPGRLLPILLPLVLALPANGIVWASLSPRQAEAVEAEASTIAGGASKPTCTRPADLKALAALPPMRLLTTMDAGPFILVQTPHTVLAGPYHRNIDGNVTALRAFLAAPADAAVIARASGAQHLAFCAAQSDVDALSARAPEGLAARLRAGNVPDWLTRANNAGPWTIYEIE